MDDKTDASTSVSKPLIRGKISWPESPSVKQCFSLPESVMYYMAMNPSTPEAYNKLIQCCKYFFEKNPILVVASVKHDKRTTICSEESCYISNKCCVKYDITKTSSKLWLTHELNLLGNDDASNFIPLLRQKLFRHKIRRLEIHEKIVTMNDFKFLASSLESLRIWASKIVDNAGNTVMLETLFENMCNVKHFSYYLYNIVYNVSSMISASTLSNIAKQKKFGQLLSFRVFFIPEVFPVDDLSALLNAQKTLDIFLNFDDDISEDYANQLDGLIDAVIETERNDVVIQYRGQDEKKREIMESRYFKW